MADKSVHDDDDIRFHQPGDITAFVSATKDDGDAYQDENEVFQEYIITVTDNRYHETHKLKTRYEALIHFRTSLLYNHPTWRLPELPPKGPPYASTSACAVTAVLTPCFCGSESLLSQQAR